ncbi:MAG: DUF1761 domain-containing protein [Leptospiraceae bacterium]|nr:DUF1761 domain-containing protein [Leptospiraceae bacterium]
MQPVLQINFWAVLVCIISNVFIGFLWYGPLFLKPWAKEVGIDADKKPSAAEMIPSMLMMIGGAFLTAYVLAHSIEVWRPSVWGHSGDLPSWQYGMYASMFSFIGFYLPPLLSLVAWEKKSWKLFSINAGYWFISVTVMGQILANWR